MSDFNCAIFLADGFEECEALITVDLIRRAKLTIDMISMNEDLLVHSSHNIGIMADKLFTDIHPDDYDVLILPGGARGVEKLDQNEDLKQAFAAHLRSGQLSAAICAAPSILGNMGLLEGREYTCFPTFDGEFGGNYRQIPAVTDGNLITGRGMGATMEFAFEILKQLVDDDMIDHVKNGTQYFK